MNISEASDADVPDTGHLPVRLTFELGRVELSLAETRELVPGAVVPLARSPEGMVDIVANGQRIGYGALVKIGDSFGVRVTRLTSRA